MIEWVFQRFKTPWFHIGFEIMKPDKYSYGWVSIALGFWEFGIEIDRNSNHDRV
jgi:hypothetical protein